MFQRICATLLLLFILHPQVTSRAANGEDFATAVRPILSKYCFECHSGDRIEAEIDLAEFKTVGNLRKETGVWIKVRRMLDSEQMPPRESKQPSKAERNRLREFVRQFLLEEARARAGDPGPVVLRRLSNAEYTYTLRDLTGIESLDPAAEFPIDGAAGEGFTNTGEALVMSPALLRKYLDAAKQVAQHIQFMPDGLGFSASVTRRDRTDEAIARIQSFSAPWTSDTGGSKVNLQGIEFATNTGGRLPVDKYFRALLQHRSDLKAGRCSIQQVSELSKLSPKYLGILWTELTTAGNQRSPLLESVQAVWNSAKFKTNAEIDASVKRLTDHIAAWQGALWKFNSIGHIGRAGGPPSWQQAVTPIVSKRIFNLKLPDSNNGRDVVVYLSAKDFGDGNADDVVIWKNAQLEGNNLPSIALRDVAGVKQRLDEIRHEALSKASRYLAAASEFKTTDKVGEVAQRHGLNAAALQGWLSLLAVKQAGAVSVTGHYREKHTHGTYSSIQGWGTSATPIVISNASDQELRVPGRARAHKVYAHPSPTLYSAIVWQSPIDGVFEVESVVEDAHPECGNGVEWVLQHQAKNTVVTLWKGDVSTRGKASMQKRTITVLKGQTITFYLGPRHGAYTCDLTQIDLTIKETSGEKRVWDLGADVADRISESNPLSDRLGNKNVWHFIKGEMTKIPKANGTLNLAIPPGSILDQWVKAKDQTKRAELAARLQQLLAKGTKVADDSAPDAVLRRHLLSFSVPLDDPELLRDLKPDPRFGKHPKEGEIGATDLAVRAPQTIEIRIPAELAQKRTLVVNAFLDSKHGVNGTVQLEVSTTPPSTANIDPTKPVVVNEGSAAHAATIRAMTDFRSLFPVALCYSRIVPVDQVVTVTLFYREDHQLRRLMLTTEQIAELNRLWDELYFISHEPLKRVVAFEQISEFATQDRPDLVIAFKALKGPIERRAADFRKQLIESQPSHLTDLIGLAEKAWRRRLDNAEKKEFMALYSKLRASEISHEEAIRLLFARAITSPVFLYRREVLGEGPKSSPVSNDELATRLSYFLWSSAPDQKLATLARNKQLVDQNSKVLLQQTRRMLKDQRVRRLAIHFACQWLHIRNFDKDAEKNEKLYPEFTKLRGAMYEETVQFFEDLFRNDRSILSILNSDHTFLNETLARTYGIKKVTGTNFRRVDGVREKGRGGILGMATFLASQSGASRTSPILRGNWVYETLLGERLPKPPADVPQLPESVPSGLTARQLIERHSSDPACAKCHAKIDPYGFALEQFDAIGRRRSTKVDTQTKLPDGKIITGIDGLRDYLVNQRRSDFVRQFCRKLLGFALGREVILSDEPLLNSMAEELKANGYRFNIAVEAIVKSRQFQHIRSADFAAP